MLIFNILKRYKIASQLSGKTNTLMITIAGKVEMTSTDFIYPTISSVLSDVGGSLGLWLGLGALQALNILINNSLLLANRIATWRMRSE